MNKYPLGRRDNLVVQEIDGEIMIYDLTDNKVFCLNETSALIWQLCDGNKSALEISRQKAIMTFEISQRARCASGRQIAGRRANHPEFIGELARDQ